MSEYEDLMRFWEGGVIPPKYVLGKPRSKMVTGLIYQVCPPPAKILEPGCNIGRNLDYFMQLGYEDLTAIEVSKYSLDFGALFYPKVHETAIIHVGMAEEILKTFDDEAFDATLSMAFLMHIPPESEFIMDELARVTKKVLVTSEDEVKSGSRWFRRSYKPIFESLGFTETYSIRGDHFPGLNERFFIRRFEK